ncbi:uncharacterized protein KZ484_006842 [Pholidichthys leucotaenia]
MMSQEQNLLRVSTHLSPSEAEIEDAGVRSSKRARGHPTWKQRDEEDSSEKQTSGKRSASDLAASRAKVQKTATTSVSAPAMTPPMSPSSPVRSPAPSPRFPSLVVTPHSSSSVQSAGNLSSTPRPLARSLLDSPVASTSQSSRDLNSDSVRRLEMLLRTVEVNRQQLVQLTNLVNSLVAGNIRPVEQLPDNITLPLTTVEQVDDSAFVNVLENHLGLIGGTDVKETTRRILTAGLAPEVQRKFVLMGSQTKRKFDELKLKKVICNAVRRNALTKTTDAEICAEVKTFLQTAGDRNGGRVERANKKKAASGN